MNWIFTYLLLGHATASWAIAPGPETAAEARARVDLANAAVAYEAYIAATNSPYSARVLAAATRVIWQGESRMSLEVHRGKRSRWGSDVGRARCFGQLHVSGLVPRREWEQLAGRTGIPLGPVLEILKTASGGGSCAQYVPSGPKG